MSDYFPPTSSDSPTGSGSPSHHDAPLARIGQRVVARIIDGLIFAVPLTILSVQHSTGTGKDVKVNLPGWVPWAFLAATAAYEIFCIAVWGQTIGKRVMKIRVVRFFDETVPGFAYATMRHLLPAICGAIPVPVLSYVLPIAVYARAFSDPNRQGFHDKVAGTKVVLA